MKEFNTTATCIPSKHYMVDITERVMQIKKMIDKGKYFTINRARQYGKTTTIATLAKLLQSEYTVISTSFEGIGDSGFEDEETFVKAFCRKLKTEIKTGITISKDTEEKIDGFIINRKEDKAHLDELFDVLLDWCSESEKGIVLIIDEVDSATNNQVFIDFLAQLRNSYINRDAKGIPAFQSVILAGVTDIRYLKSKIRDEDQHRLNSPWNIASDFNIDMSLSETGIKGMLDDYESDHHTGMDTAAIAKQIREYTNGYPYLVSRICQLIDESPEMQENASEAWTEFGVDEAVKRMLSDNNNTLFKSLTGKLANYPNLKEKLRTILMRGETITWLPYDEEQEQLFMYGFIRNNHNAVAVSNRIFEMLLYTHFIGENNRNNDLKQIAAETKNIFIEDDGWLDVPKIMEHFIREHNRIHGENTERFIEEEGRERFITYVAGIINGTGTYSIEEQTRDHKRTDMVIHYLGRKYIIELKIWRGNRYNEEGEKQIMEYMDRFELTTGYMLSFNFNKQKKPGVERLQIDDKTLYEGIV
ncbi:MAG: AAA-like domain-containing protein [Eubacterium sp.]|nr:AAA-like domain-containing protein [Eubacterium sp.]